MCEHTNVSMCLCADTLIRTYANTQTHICACVLYVSLTWHFFAGFRGWKHRGSEGFVWRTHILLLDLRDSHVASLLRMTKVTHYHPTTDGNYHITTWGIVMPLNNGRPLINAGKAQEPMDSWAFPFSSLCWMKHQRFRSRWMSDRR